MLSKAGIIQQMIMFLSNRQVFTTQYQSMKNEAQKTIEGKSRNDEASYKNTEKKPTFIWLEKEQRFTYRVRLHVKKYYSLHSASMSIFFRKNSELDEEGIQQVKDRFKAGEKFCLKDRETAKEIPAWYICFNKHIQYAQLILDKVKKANSEDSVNFYFQRWEHTYPVILEERRIAELRQNQSIFKKAVRSIGAFFQRSNQKASKTDLEARLLPRKTQPQA